jgi:ATP-dependent DNA helicase HFM1/MER3
MDFMELLDRELSSDDAAFIASTSNLEGNDDTRDGYTTKYTPGERNLGNDGAWKVNIQAFVDKTNDQMLDTSNSSHIFYHNGQYNEQLIPTSKLADKSRSIFKFNYFNRMQSKCFHTIYEQNHNCVISSPTGSGKTVLFELAILRLLNRHSNVSNIKILYIAPTKALCLEREKDWAKKFCVLGLSVGVLTSDTSFVETDKVKRSNIIITTPEKWDLMTRKWSDYTKLFEMIRVLFVDEIHILREDRGSTLEVVVTRMKKICSSMRVIALSATVPNIQDVAGWIKLDSSTPSNAVTMVFGDEFRPVKLQRVIYGYKQASNDFVFDSYLNPKILEVLNEHSNNRPVLIFCPTRSSTVSTAKYVAKNFQGLVNLNNKRLKAKEKDLNDIMSKGVSYHHAGLAMEDRNAVEQNFIGGSTRILCSTSTLAVGVNLPAYLVVIKGTKIWNSSQFEEYSELDVLQMMGRAGRPQFEKEGKAVLMTSDTNRQHYEKLVKGNEKLESRLHLNLPENLVSEIYLRTVTSLEDTLDWLKHTFFYSRYSANPTAYNEIPYSSESNIDARLLKYCESKIRELIDFKLIESKGISYHSTPYGDSMTRHYVLFDTMKSFVRAHKQQGVSDILHLLSKASEFKVLRLKRNEKRLFREINLSPFIKSPIKLDKKRKNIEERFEKIFLIIQFELGGVEYPNDTDLIKLQQSFKQDKLFVFKHVVRLARCLADCFVTKKDFFSLRNCLKVVTYLNAGCWGDRPVVLSQIDGINRNQVRRLANQSVRNFTDLKSLDSGKVEYYLGLRPGQSKKIISQVNNLPELSLSLKVSKVSKSRFSKGLCITIGVDFRCEQSQKWKGRPVSIVVISGLTSGDMVDYRRSFLSTVGSRSFTFEFHLLHNDVKLTTVALCEEVSGLSETCTIDLMDFVPENFRDSLYDNPVLYGIILPPQSYFCHRNILLTYTFIRG